MKILKKLKRRTIIIAVIVIIIVFVIFNFFIGNGELEYIAEEVVRGTVIKEVSETGMVKISEQVDLGFKYSGRIDEIYVKVGDQVEAGQNLAKLDLGQLYIELAEAQAALNVAKADYDKLLAGSSAEEIKVSETDVLNAQIVFDNAKQSLEDAKADAEEDLKQDYENALSDLEDAYLKIYNSYNVVLSVQLSYFNSTDQEGVIVKDNKDLIYANLTLAKTQVDNAEAGSRQEVDTALSEMKKILSEVKNSLEIVRDVTENVLYRNTVTSSDKTSLDNQKSYINTAYNDIVAAQQTIATTRITNETNINTKEAAVGAAEVALQKAQDQLDLKKAGPTQENINLYQAKIKQAEAKVALLQNKINDSTLKSPVKGQITSINKRRGETAQVTDSIISILPSGPFQIEVDIYEEDIVYVKVNDETEIFIPAFPDDLFAGEVISIDPAEKLIDGVVYYEVNISFDAGDKGVKPGMTADVVIKADERENVLVIPKQALKKINGDKIVKVLDGKEVEERKIEIGLEGEDNIEVISGLIEGERVVLGEKAK